MSAFTKGIYKTEVQCEIRMQVKILKLTSRKEYSCNQIMKNNKFEVEIKKLS
jgi:hypothetical protein